VSVAVAPQAGPASGAPRWFTDVRRFLAEHHEVKLATLHRLDLFAQAAPAGSRLLTVLQPRGAGQFRAYATRAPDETVRIVVIDDGDRARKLTVRTPGATGTGALELLTAPSLRAKSNVTLGGQSFGTTTTTGLLAAAQKTYAVSPSKHEYAIKVPPASAALLTLPPT